MVALCFVCFLVRSEMYSRVQKTKRNEMAKNETKTATTLQFNSIGGAHRRVH